MNLILWIVAGLLALAFLASAVMKLTQPKAKLASSGMRWTEDFGPGTVKVIGLLELLAAVGLILPAVLNIAPVVVSVAALGLAAIMLGTPSITDPADRGEPAFCILVAVGRWIKPAAYRTLVGIGQIVRASDLDWTIVRVPLLTDGPHASGSTSAPSGTRRYPIVPSQRRCLLPPAGRGHHPGRPGPLTMDT